MVYDLIKEYEEHFDTEISLPLFDRLDEEEQIKILKECLEKNEQIYENDYFNKNYMEEVYD